MTRSVIRAFALAALLPVLAGGCGAPGVQTRPVLSHKSDDPQAELRIADSALAGGNVDLASTLYEKVLAKHPDSLAARQGSATSTTARATWACADSL